MRDLAKKMHYFTIQTHQARRQGVGNAKPAMRAAQSRVVSPRQQPQQQQQQPRTQGRGRGRSFQAGGGRVSRTSDAGGVLEFLMCVDM